MDSSTISAAAVAADRCGGRPVGHAIGPHNSYAEDHYCELNQRRLYGFWFEQWDRAATCSMGKWQAFHIKEILRGKIVASRPSAVRS